MATYIAMSTWRIRDSASSASCGYSAPPQAGRDSQRIAAQAVGLGDAVEDGAAQRVDPRLVRGVVQDDDEFVAAQARHEAGLGRRAGLQAPGDLDQQPVARRVPHGIVDLLEQVQIQEQQRQGLARLVRRLDGGLQALVEILAVRQAGQGIVVRLVPDLRLDLLFLRHVAEHRHPAVDRAVVVPGRVHDHALGIVLARLALAPVFAFPASLGVDGMPHLVVEIAVVAARPQQRQQLAGDLVGPEARHPRIGRIDVDDHPGRIGDGDGLAAVLVGDGGELGRGLGLLALGDVLHDADDRDLLAHPHGRAEHLDVDLRTVLAAAMALEAQRAVPPALAGLDRFGHQEALARHHDGQQRHGVDHLARLVAEDLGHLAADEGEALVLDQEDPHDGVRGQALEDGVGPQQARLILAHLGQQVVDLPDAVVEILRHLAELALAPIADAGVVVSLDQLPAGDAQFAQGPDQMAAQQQVQAQQQDQVQQRQPAAGQQGAVLVLAQQRHQDVGAGVERAQQGLGVVGHPLALDDLGQFARLGRALVAHVGAQQHGLQPAAQGDPVAPDAGQEIARGRLRQGGDLAAVDDAALVQGLQGAIHEVHFLAELARLHQGAVGQAHRPHRQLLAGGAHAVQGDGLVERALVARQQGMHGGGIAQHEDQHEQEKDGCRRARSEGGSDRRPCHVRCVRAHAFPVR
nr:hypothetical protein [Castellaniella defragrans]